MTYKQLLSSWMDRIPKVNKPLKGTEWDMVREALEKQIPMKPILVHETDCSVRHYLCPVCDEWVSEGANYCYECGQAIDWSDEK